jgi:PAS domain S-box-containing protein
MAEILGDATFAIVKPKMEAAFAGQTVSYEATLPYKSGGARYVLATYTPDRVEDGEVVGAFVLVQDLSARRHAEDALADSERALRASGAEFEAFFELPNVGKVQADPATGRILRVNAKLCRITGYAEDELLAQRIVDLTHPDAPDQEAFAAFARGDVDEYQIEKRYTRKDGQAIWLRVDASLLRDETGRPHKTIAAVRDITPEKLSQEMLRRSERSHRLIVSLHDATRGTREPARVVREFVRIVGQHFAASRCAYGEVDADLGMVSVMLDYTDRVPTVAGMHLLDDLGADLIAALTAGRTVAIEDTHQDPRTSSGAARQFLDRIAVRALLCVPLVKEGRFVSMLMLHHVEPRAWSPDDLDLMELIAERTWFAVENARAEVLLREHRDVLALAMRGGRMGAWSRDLRTNRVWWSRELEEIVGLPPDGFDGDEEGFFALVHEEDRGSVSTAVAEAIASRADYAVEFRFGHASGEWRWMEGRGRAVYDAAGAPETLYGIAIDITERKRVEDELRRLNAELSDADRRKDDFIAMLAHELRNPLAPVRFSVELLRLRGPSATELEQARETIERQVRQMAKLLDDLLDVARVSRGKLQIERTPTSLTAVIQMALETSRPLLDVHRHDLRVALPGEDVVVLGDTARLTQVFANLLNNAARYTPAHGVVTLRAGVEDDRAVVRIRDTGIGLRDDQLQLIFKPFSQAHEAGHSGGLGLGLALARAIVTLHEGAIAAHSEGPGRGAEFVVSLPLAPHMDEAPPAGQATGAASTRRLRVLVVDDNRDAADSLAVLLSLDGHRVAAAYDGADAIERALTWQPDVVLLDIGLPDMSGYEVARRLRTVEGGRPLSIIAISGWGQQRDKEEALEAGCDAHLTKPANPAEVRELLNALPARRPPP